MKKYSGLALILLATLPLVSEAATSVQTLLVEAGQFLNTTAIPFLFGIAFLFFIVNVIRYFVIGGGNEESRDKAKSLALYGVGAFVFLAIFWGIINLLVDTSDLSDYEAPCSDYMEKMGGCTDQPRQTNQSNSKYIPFDN
jgi:succinate dehydrogenase/fumarate reductase cytochrome b subunit